MLRSVYTVYMFLKNLGPAKLFMIDQHKHNALYSDEPMGCVGNVPLEKKKRLKRYIEKQNPTEFVFFKCKSLLITSGGHCVTVTSEDRKTNSTITPLKIKICLGVSLQNDQTLPLIIPEINGGLFTAETITDK